MNPAKRAKRLQAHSLRCQGLTYRQIGERMRCAHSTAARYVRDFEANRAEIIESLAADLLVHSVANLQNPDPDLHASAHQRGARTPPPRQLPRSGRRPPPEASQRRVAMEEEADALKNIQALEDLVVTMHENGIDDMTPYLTDHGAFRTPHFQQPLPQTSPSGAGARTLSQTSPSGGGAPKGRRGPTATTCEGHPIPDHSSSNHHPGPRPRTEQIRTKPSKIEQDRPRSPTIPRETTPNPAQTPENSSFPVSSSPLPSPCPSPVTAAISAPTPPSADSSATGFALDPPRLPSTHGTRHQAQSATRT